MNIVLTMAGKYSRFRLFGNQIPKYLLPLARGTVLMEILNALHNSAVGADYFMIANRNDQMFYPILKSILGAYGIPIKNILYINDTNSQLETALNAVEFLDSGSIEKPIAFANIDTVVRNRGEFFNSLEGLGCDEALLDVFSGESKQYSYALAGEDGCVNHVVDKTVVSEYACSGLYGFGSFRSMREAAEKLVDEKESPNFTDLYNFNIKNSKKVYLKVSSNPADTCVMGTPEEYLINIHRFG